MTNVKKLLQLCKRELQLVLIDKLIGLEKTMEKKVAFLPVDQAVEAFWT
jgi:hypothetical protein